MRILNMIKRNRKTKRVNEYIIHFYRMQIAKFEKIGIGGYTQDGTRVTEQLMAVTRRRLSQLL